MRVFPLWAKHGLPTPVSFPSTGEALVSIIFIRSSTTSTLDNQSSVFNMCFPTLFLGVVVTSALAWTGYWWLCLWQNYQYARKLGIPLRILPISHGNPFWMIVDRWVVKYARRLPFGDNSFTRYNWRGWEVDDRCRSHLEMGDVYMQVTPGKNWLYLCNPESLLDMFRQRSDFPRPLEIYGS